MSRLSPGPPRVGHPKAFFRIKAWPPANHLALRRICLLVVPVPQRLSRRTTSSWIPLLSSARRTTSSNDLETQSLPLTKSHRALRIAVTRSIRLLAHVITIVVRVLMFAHRIRGLRAQCKGVSSTDICWNCVDREIYNCWKRPITGGFCSALVGLYRLSASQRAYPSSRQFDLTPGHSSMLPKRPERGPQHLLGASV